MTVTSFAPVRTFYCFDPADQAYVSSLDRHLAPLKQAGRIQTWDEREVLAGSEWERERNQHFSAARLLILFLSPDFLASTRGMQDIQMALDRQQAGQAVVIPLLLRPCLWKETKLNPLQILPRDHNALDIQAHPDFVWQEMVSEIIRVLDSLKQWVYIISAPEDQEIVERLSQDMTRFGVTIWHLKGNQLSPDLAEEREAMRQASSAILVVSPAAFSSRVVRTQKELADVYKRPIQVVWVSGEWPDAGAWHEEGMLDARAERYETAKESLMALVTPVIEVVTSLEEPLQPATEPRNPYKGLQSFTAQDTRDFFGREALIDELAMTLEHLLDQEKQGQLDGRLLAVLGASGSGKSSVMLAGLLPHLQQGKVFNSQDWLYLDPIVPGTHPMETLALSLAQQSSLGQVASLHRELTADSLRALHLLARQLVNSPLRKTVLFIDQFEEVFTLTVSEEERQHFIDLLTTAVTEPQGPLLVILTLRADFSDRAMQYPELYRLLDAHHVSVLPIERGDLRRVIEQPARLPDVQIIFEDDLVGDLLFDMREQVGTLPLLSFTLDQLFAHRKGRMLTLHAYHEIGGVKGALAKHAQSTYDALPTKDHHMLAQSLFLRLIDPGRTEQDTTRRRASLSEFERPDSAQTKLLRETIDAFLAARLLLTNEYAGVSTIEVSHEALIREWPLLVKWLREERSDILLQQKISEDAAEWQQRYHSSDRLYRGSQLKEARTWAKRSQPSENELAFLRKSTRHQQQSRVFQIAVPLLVLLLSIPSTLWIVGNILTRSTPICVSGHITISGSSALSSLVQRLALSYEAQCPGASIDIFSASSVLGLSNIESGKSNIGLSDIIAPSQLADLVDHPIAIAVFSLILNKSVIGITNLSIRQIQEIYSGSFTNWNELGGPNLPITVISRASTSGTRQVFEHYILKGPESLPLSPSHVEVDTTSLLANTVADTVGAIGYTDIGTIAANQPLQIVSIDNAQASPAMVVSNRYPFWVVEHMYTKGLPPSSTLVSAFLQYMNGDTARAAEASLFLVNFNDMTRDALAAHAL